MRFNLGPANRHAAFCFSRLRWLPVTMKDLFRKEGVWDDLIQELYTTAFVAWKRGMDDKETDRYADRQIHAFLKAYGLRSYRGGYVRFEIPFSAVFKDVNIADRGLAFGDNPPVPFVDADGLGEKILALLKMHPQGLSKTELLFSLEVSAQERDWHVAHLIRRGLVIEIKRENTFGRPPAPLLVAATPGQTLPTPGLVKTERIERIRQAYYVEGKSISQIARDLHRCERTVLRALRSAAPRARVADKIPSSCSAARG